MPDGREKVIKGLENCITGFDCPPECPYLDDCNDLMKPMFVELAKDALALLKEQEAVEVEIEGGGSNWWYVCSECHGAIDRADQYCRHCGRKVMTE